MAAGKMPGWHRVTSPDHPVRTGAARAYGEALLGAAVHARGPDGGRARAARRRVRARGLRQPRSSAARCLPSPVPSHPRLRPPQALLLTQAARSRSSARRSWRAITWSTCMRRRASHMAPSASRCCGARTPMCCWQAQQTTASVRVTCICVRKDITQGCGQGARLDALTAGSWSKPLLWLPRAASME